MMLVQVLPIHALDSDTPGVLISQREYYMYRQNSSTCPGSSLHYALSGLYH